MKPNKRDSKEYATWRKAILKRDKHKCQFPGCHKRQRLHVHHIQKWSTSPFLRYEVSNGIVLCKKCHDNITGYEDYYITLFLQIVSQNENNNRH